MTPSVAAPGVAHPSDATVSSYSHEAMWADFWFANEPETNMLCTAMRIQLSESIYDNLVTYEPKFVITERGLRNVLVSIEAFLSRIETAS